MMQAMKGATGVLGNMNRSMNLPALQRIAREFERENDIMDQRHAIDDVTGLEDEAEGEEVVEQVLEEIGVDLKNSVSLDCACVRAYLSGYLVDCLTRWVKPLKVFRLQQFPKAELRRLLEDQLGIREMMISKQDWTV